MTFLKSEPIKKPRTKFQLGLIKDVVKANKVFIPKFLQELPGVGFANTKGINRGLNVTMSMKKVIVPSYDLGHAPTWHNPDVSETTVRHPNELKLNWLKAEGLLIVFMYTHLSSREVIKSVKRFKRSIRKVYGREQYNNLTSRLVLHYIWSGNSVDVLESYKKAVIGPLTNPVNYSWFAPAGTDKGIANETL